jgi:predicted dehydrogenase
MARLPLAVVGAGVIGRSHIRYIRASEHCELAAIADPAPAAAALASELGVPHFAHLDAMLARARPAGAIIATPNVAHVPSALACLARDVPVLVEKPIADTLADAGKLVAAARRARLPLLVGHHRRHNPILGAARDLVRSGALGRIVTVTAVQTLLKPDAYFGIGERSDAVLRTATAWRREPGGGPVLINLIHAVDDLRFMVGDIKSLQAFTSSGVRGFAVEDTAVVGLRFAGGALGTMTLSDTAAAPWSWELTAGENPAYPHVPADCYFISGTQGSLAVPSLRRWHYGVETGWMAPLLSEQVAVAQADPLARQIDHFCAVIRGEAATRTLAATLAVHEAAASGREVVLG